MSMPKYLPLAVVALPLFATITSSGNVESDSLDVHELMLATVSHHHADVRPTKHVDGKQTLNLVHRDTVSGRHFSGHRHRFDERMKRDSTRVAALDRRLSSDGTANYHEEDFGSEVVSGLEEGSGEYFVRIGVGSPPREQYMVIDTGSDIAWVQCQPCSQCYRQSDPVFDPAESATFSGIACGSPICSFLAGSADRCRGGRCRYEVSYGDGSYTMGTLALETLTFGPTTIQNVAIGCGHRNRGLFIGAAGLLGLGWGAMSFLGQLGGQVGGAFGYCLASRGAAAASGSLVFGRSAAVPVGAVWVPLLRNLRAPSFYYVGLVGLGVGGMRLPVAEDIFELSSDGYGGTVMDTGTAVTRLPGPVYEILQTAFSAETTNLQRVPGVSIFDTCYDLSGYGSVQVPTVSFYFAGGPILTLPAKNFLIPVDEVGTFCFAFAPSGSRLSIVGNIQQEGIQITVDAANGFLGFGPQNC